MQEKFRNLQENLEKAQDIIDEVSLKDVEVMTMWKYFLAVYSLYIHIAWSCFNHQMFHAHSK